MDHNSVLRRPLRFRFFNATLYLIAANVLIFALGYVWPMLTYILALSPRAVMAGWVWQVFTYMFAHANLTHLLVNMLGLFFFGRPWSAASAATSFCSIIFFRDSSPASRRSRSTRFRGMEHMLLGASGAIFALLLAFAVLIQGDGVSLRHYPHPRSGDGHRLHRNRDRLVLSGASSSVRTDASWGLWLGRHISLSGWV